jgi:C-terminal processing protease CtpA/Prc
MKKLWILVLAALLQACGGGGGGYTPTPTPTGGDAQPPQACSIAQQRQTVLDFMTNEYFWYPQLKAPDANAASMDAYFQSMLYRPTDRFSFTESTEAYDQLFVEGTFTGYGYSYAIVDVANAVLRVRTVEPQGPAFAAGLRRGDTILSVDGHSPAEVLAGAAGAVSTEGVPRTITVRDTAGSTKTLQMVSATFPLTPVRDVAVLDATRNGQPVKVGYLGYTQFVTYSIDGLNAAVASFVAAGASEMVLDLRYNGGGDVATTRDLANLVAGSRLAGQVFASLRYNDKNTAKNMDFRFHSVAAAIPNLPRVFIIASGSTASASELVINGLKPYMDVVLIGATTYGKPYGFEPFDYCGTTYNAVNFEVVNSLGVGGYTSGFAPTCPVADDLDHALGDPNEARLKTALSYIATGQCPQSPQSAPLASQSAPALGDVPRPGMFRR